LDVFIVVILLFAVAFSFLLASMLQTKFQAQINNGGFNTTVSAKAFTSIDKAFTVFDNMILAIFGFVNIAAIWFAWKVKATPALIFIGLFLLMFNIVLAVISSNTYEELKTQPLLAAEVGKFPKTDYLMTKLPIFAIIADLLILFALHASQRDFNA